MHRCTPNRPGCMPAARALLPGRGHSVRWVRCRGAHSAVFQAQRLAVSWPKRLCRRPCSSAGTAVSRPCVATQPNGLASTPLSRYNDCIVTHSPTIKPSLVTLQNLYRDALPSSQALSLSRYNKLHRDTLLQPKLPPPVTIQFDCIVTCTSAHYTLRRLCHDTIFHCIVTQFG